MTVPIARRKFVVALAGAAAAWPLAAGAQQPNRVRRIGVLMPYDENDPVVKPRLSAFTQDLASLGWAEGRNLRVDLRWLGDGSDINRIRALARLSWLNLPCALMPAIGYSKRTFAAASLPRHRGRSMLLSSGDSESGPGPFGGDWDEADLDRLAIGCNPGHWIILRYMGTESIPSRAYAKMVQMFI